MTEDSLTITPTLSLPVSEVTLSAIRAQGAGGQNVNKVSSAIHLRFDVHRSSLPNHIKQQLLEINDKRLTQDGCIVLKAQQFRTQEQNRQDALERLESLIIDALKKPAKRIATRPTRSAKRKRTDAKTKRGSVKRLRGKVQDI